MHIMAQSIKKNNSWKHCESCAEKPKTTISFRLAKSTEHAFHLPKREDKGETPQSKQQLKGAAAEAWKSTSKEKKQFSDVYNVQTMDLKPNFKFY